MKNPFLKTVGNKFTLMGRPATFKTGTQMQPNMEIQRYEVRGSKRPLAYNSGNLSGKKNVTTT